MRAKITKKDGFTCAPEGHTVVTIPCGTIVEGDVAKMALSAHAGARIMEADTKQDKRKISTKSKGAKS